MLVQLATGTSIRCAPFACTRLEEGHDLNLCGKPSTKRALRTFTRSCWEELTGYYCRRSRLRRHALIQSPNTYQAAERSAISR
jgi:hypothetical protein